jgi:hypothetical protein
MEETINEETINEETINEEKRETVKVPAEFKKIIVDMTKDILVSFPEQRNNLNKELANLIFETDVANLEHSLKYVFVFCKTVYPARFFDILYQKNEIFETDPIEFLPGINFAPLWRENISDKTRETLWKYLQLVLFNIVSSISDGNTLGDTAKLFEAINEDEFKSKLEETITQMHSLFGEQKGEEDEDDEKEGSDGEKKAGGGGGGGGGINLEDLPNPSDIHEHVTNMMNGKLGKLAREIAEETAADLNINMENAESISDVFKRLMNNPTKLMSLVKNVGSKLDEKMKSGDVKESELLEEASEMMKKMKNMPGMGDLQSMLNKMGMNAGKGTGKVNVNAMQTNLDQKLKKAKNNERLLRKMAENKEAILNAKAQRQAQTVQVEQQAETLVFSKGEHVERSTREQAPVPALPGQAPELEAQKAPAKKKKNKK